MMILNQTNNRYKFAIRAILLVSALLLMFILLGLTRAKPKAAQVPVIELWDVQGRVVGMATLTQTDRGVQIDVSVHSMMPVAGDHGIHIHEVGKCDLPTFESAGGIYNPTGAQHGFNHPAGPMAGDLWLMPFNADGSALYQALTSYFNINDLYDADGSSLIIHASPDNHTTQPDGQSGERIICGLIAHPQVQQYQPVYEEVPQESSEAQPEVIEEVSQEVIPVEPGDELGAVLYDSLGRIVGAATMSQGGSLVGVNVVLNDLQRVPGNHRIAVTSVSLCETPDFTTAGWEISVLPDMQLFASGYANYQAVSDWFTTTSLLDGDGSALVIYADTGDENGERIICGPLGPLENLLNGLGLSDVQQLMQ